MRTTLPSVQGVYGHLERLPELMPGLLADPSRWDSLDITYHPPRVERIFTDLGGGWRVYCHYIHPVLPGQESLFHPHYRVAGIVVHGAPGCSYRMTVGSAVGVSAPPVVMDMIVSGEFRYVMNHPDGWHAVMPIGGPVYSTDIFGPSMKRMVPPETRSAKGTLPPLSDRRRLEMVHHFQTIWTT